MNANGIKITNGHLPSQKPQVHDTTKPHTNGPVPKYTGRLLGKRVLVIGGTSGIGFAVAEAAVEHGAHVTIVGSKPEKLSKALERLKSCYHPPGVEVTIQGTTCDLLEAETLEVNVERILKLAAADSKINHVVFTAADMAQPPALTAVTVEAIQKIGVIRYAAPVMVGKHLNKYMDLKPQNSFTMTSGMHTEKPDEGWTLICGYCGAVESLMRGFAIDLRPLRVNVVSPGAVLTEVVRDILGDAMEGEVEKARQKATTGTVGAPEDVAEAYIYVMKDCYISGSVVSSNGGLLLR